jgi:hypothetical protein
VVTRTQIARLSQRINLVAEQLSLGERTEYRVALQFDGQTPKEFRAQYPWWDEPGGSRVILTFGNDVPMLHRQNAES